MEHEFEEAACRHIGLVRSAVGSVAICPDCQVVHLNLQHLSLRLEPSAFRELGRMLVSAQQRLDGWMPPAHEAVAARDVDGSADVALH